MNDVTHELSNIAFYKSRITDELTKCSIVLAPRIYPQLTLSLSLKMLKMRTLLFIFVLLSLITVSAQKIDLSVQTGHSSTINAVKYNHDYSLIGSASSDNNVAIWDIKSGKQLANLTGHTASVSGIVFHPKKDILYSAGMDSTVIVWDAKRSTIIKKIKFDFPLGGISIDPKGTKIAVVGKSLAVVETADYSIHYFDVSSSHLFSAVQFADDGNILALGGKKERFGYVVDIAQKEVITRLVATMNNITFDPYGDGAFYYAAENGALMHYDYVNHKSKATTNKSEWNSFNAVQISNRFIIGGTDKGDVILYYRNRWKRLHTLKGHLLGIQCMDIDNTGRRLITAGTDKRIILWDLEKLTMISSFRSSIYRISDIQFSKDEEDIVIGFSNGVVRRTNLSTNTTVSNRSRLHPSQIKNGVEFFLSGITELSDEKASFDMMLMRKSAGIEGAYDGLKNGTLNWYFSDNEIVYELSNGKGSLIRKYEQALREDKVLSTDMFINTSILSDVSKNWMAKIDKNILNIRERNDSQIEYSIELSHTDRVTAVAINEKYHFVATASWDGMLKFWSLKDGSLLTTYGTFGSDDFVYINEDNYYFASKGALDNIGFVMDGQVFSFDQFDLKYNRPDLVFKDLPYVDQETVKNYNRAYEKRLKKLNLTAEDLVVSTEIPVLDVENTTGSYTTYGNAYLKIRAKDSIHNLSSIHALVNGVPIWSRKGKALEENDVELSENIRLNPGTNIIQLYVTNDQGASSFKTTMKVVSTKKEAKSDLYLITLGCSKYQQSDFNLNFAEKDANDITEFFTKGKLFRTVHSKNMVNEQVTLEGVESLKKFIAPATENDVVLLFIAGHGVLDANLDYYIATHDMDFMHPEEKGIPFSFFDDLLDETASRKKLMFIDACHSGEIDKSEVELDSNTVAIEEGDISFRAVGNSVKNVNSVNSFELSKIVFADVRESNGSTVVSSAGGGEFSLEGADWNNGVFTYALLNGIKSGEADLNRDKRIYLSEVQTYLIQTVNRLTGGQQTPTSRAENLINDFRIY